MTLHKHWSLGAKLALVGAPFLLLTVRQRYGLPR